MTQFKQFTAQFPVICSRLGKLAIASWLMTNTMFLLTSRTPFVSLDFVRQIPLESFVCIWMGICACMVFPYLFSAVRRNINFSLAPSVMIYIATLMLKETLIL